MAYKPDNHSLAQDWYGVDFRANPELYRIGRSEQGVLTAEPYKSELLPYWKFKTPEIAAKSVADLELMYEKYCSDNDYVGMDMARKFVQMGKTRAKRYGRHASGKKYDGPVPDDKKGISGSHGREELPLDIDPVKMKCSEIFKIYYDEIMSDPRYIEARKHLKP